MSTTKKRIAAAVDLGNGHIKIRSSKRRSHFPTAMLAKEKTGRAVLGSFGGNKGARLFSTAINDNHPMYFGPSLMETGYEKNWIPSIGFGMSRYASLEFKAMFEYTLALIAEDYAEEMLEIDLVTGLPTLDEQNSEIIDYLADFLKRSHTVKILDEHTNEATDVSYIVKKLIIVPQYYGTLWNLAVDDDFNILEPRIFDGTVGVSDFGRGTVLVDISHQLQLGAEGSPWQDDRGVDYFMRGVRLTSPLPDSVIERIYLEGNEEAGYHYRPVNPMQAKNVTEDFMAKREEATDYMKGIYRRQFPKPEELSVIYQTGGGANFLLEKPLKALLDGKVELVFVKDSQMSNVDGYYKIAMRSGFGEYEGDPKND